MSDFAIVYFAPLVPAAFLFYFLDPNKIVAHSSGKVLGFTIKGGGAFGAYLALLLLSLAAYKFVVHPDGGLQLTKYSVSLRSSDGERIGQFLRDEGRSLTVALENPQSEPIHLSSGSVDPEKYTVTGEQALPSEAFGRPYRVRIFSKSVELKPEHDSIKLTRNIHITATLPAYDTGDWKLAFEITEHAYSRTSSRITVTSRQIFVFVNPNSAPLREILFPSYEFPSIKVFRIWARRLDPSLHTSLVGRWSREQVGHYTPNQVERLTEEIFLAYEQAGEEIGRIKSTIGKPLERVGDVKLGGNGSTPKIGPIAAGVRAGEAVAVYVHVEADESDEQQWLGRRFFYNTDHALLIVKSKGPLSIDQKSVNVEYLKRGEPVSAFGNPRRLIFGGQILLFDLQNVDVNLLARIHWLWDKS